MQLLIINELRWHFGKKLQHLMLSYDFYLYDEDRKTKNLGGVCPTDAKIRNGV